MKKPAQAWGWDQMSTRSVQAARRYLKKNDQRQPANSVYIPGPKDNFAIQQAFEHSLLRAEHLTQQEKHWWLPSRQEQLNEKEKTKSMIQVAEARALSD